MMNTLTFVLLVMLAEVWVVWLAYSMGHASGWCEGMDHRRERQ